jgi:hypothetical protein
MPLPAAYAAYAITITLLPHAHRLSGLAYRLQSVIMRLRPMFMRSGRAVEKATEYGLHAITRLSGGRAQMILAARGGSAKDAVCKVVFNKQQIRIINLEEYSKPTAKWVEHWIQTELQAKGDLAISSVAATLANQGPVREPLDPLFFAQLAGW